MNSSVLLMTPLRERFDFPTLEPPTFLDHLPDGESLERAALPESLHLLDRRSNIGLFAGRSRHEHRDRDAVLGDGDAFALGDPLEELGEMCLGLVGTDGVRPSLRAC